MTSRSAVHRSAAAALIAVFLLTIIPVRHVAADSTAQTPPFSQAWTNPGLITLNGNWSGVPGIVGFRGDNLAAVPGTDPQQVTVASAVIDVNANETDPNTFGPGGVTEFDTLADPVVALKGSTTADAPNIVLTLDTTGLIDLHVAYNLRDVDGSTNDAFQSVALQYRVGMTGLFTNLPAGFVEDATTGPSLATLVTAVSVTLPAVASNKPTVQVRVITTDAPGFDEWVGVDDISVTGRGDQAPVVESTTPTSGATGTALDANISITFSEPVNVTGDWYGITCATSGLHTATVTGGPATFTLDPGLDFVTDESCAVTVFAAGVTDQDLIDPPNAMTDGYAFSYTTEEDNAPPTVIWDFDGFRKPIEALREVKAGSTLPLKFSLGGDQGLAIFRPGYPASESFVCGTTPPSIATQPAALTGPTGFRYDGSRDEYIFLWKTDKSWGDTCRVFVLGLADGTTHDIVVHFQ